MKDIAFLHLVVEHFHDLLQDSGFSERELEAIYENWGKISPRLENVLRSKDLDEDTFAPVVADVTNPRDPLKEDDLLIPHPTTEKVKPKENVNLDADHLTNISPVIPSTDEVQIEEWKNNYHVRVD